MSDTGQWPNHAAGYAARKAALRERLLAARRALTPEVRGTAAQRVRATLLATLTESGARTIAGYVPFGTEPGGPDLPAALVPALPPGGRLLLPVLLPDRSLDWAVYAAPPGPPLGTAAIAEASVVVVPALAVDRRGMRLGRGGGSYDRALALAAPDALVVALLHDGELRDDDLPAAPHDRPVSAVITPGLGLVRFPAA